MYTIQEASVRTGVSVASLRAWERRYGIVRPHRSESGYRLYDDPAIAALSAMRQLVENGWSPATAAAAIAKDGPDAVLGRAARPVVTSADADVTGAAPLHRRVDERDVRTSPDRSGHPEGRRLTEEFLAAAAAVDAVALESVLDRGFGLGTFEVVVDGWLMPTMRALGDAWAEGELDIAGEHAASSAVMRRLGQSFAAASSVGNGTRVLVGLPAGSHHELGALAFATAARRRGLTVVYVGADLPVESWQRAVRAFPTEIAVIGVPTNGDQPKAAETAEVLRSAKPGLVIAAGGPRTDQLPPEVVRLPKSVGEAARIVEGLRR